MAITEAVRNIRKKIRLFREFGPLVAFSSACSSAIRRPMAVTRWKDRCILNWLKEHYPHVLLRHKQESFPAASQEIQAGPAPIWSIWWQGEESLPEAVKICFASVNRHRGEHPFRIITRENYREYIHLPEHVMQKVRSGIVSLTKLSNMLRLYLLYHYGGLWVDATVLAAGDIPEEIFAFPYYTIKRGPNPRSYGVALERWTTFFQAAQRGNPLCGFVLDFHLEYWKDQVLPIDYSLFCYVIALACEELPECRRLIDAVPANNRDVDSLRPLLNSPWDPAVYEKLTAATRFFKLTWKRPFAKTSRGRETFYGHLAGLYLPSDGGGPA